jgi:hypothetical protein
MSNTHGPFSGGGQHWIMKYGVLWVITSLDFTGKPMKGYVYVEPEGFEADDD